MRHEFFDTVLSQKQSVDYVIENLKKANFDPEFFTTFEKEITVAFQTQFSLAQSI
jgi:hypothetical protein